MNIEPLENWKEVFEFVGRNIDYRQPFVLNIPFLADVWHGSHVGLRLVVATNRQDGKIVDCALRLLIETDAEKAREVNPNFQSVVPIFGESEELGKFADDVAMGLL